jgi:hypothetical protein
MPCKDEVDSEQPLGERSSPRLPFVQREKIDEKFA